MTRFWITLPQAVDLVLYALEHMDGGEIFIPKIPSMRVTDLAEAIAPGVPREVIGIRPGEKLHELLITADESRHTIDAGDVYVVLPEHPWWDRRTRAGRRQAARRRLRVRERHERRVARRARRAAQADRCRDPVRPPVDRRRRHRRGGRGAARRLADQGPAVERVRGGARRAWSGARHAVAFANGTAALHARRCGGRARPGRHASRPRRCRSWPARTAPARSAPTPRSSTSTRRRSTSIPRPSPTAVDALVAVHYAGLPVDLDRAARTGRGS